MDYSSYFIFRTLRILYRRIKRHKFLFVGLLLFIAFLFIKNNCFAFTLDYNGTSYDVPDLPFDTQTHDTFLFGYRNTNDTFIVGYPVNIPVNNKVFCSPSDRCRF